MMIEEYVLFKDFWEYTVVYIESNVTTEMIYCAPGRCNFFFLLLARFFQTERMSEANILECEDFNYTEL